SRARGRSGARSRRSSSGRWRQGWRSCSRARFHRRFKAMATKRRTVKPARPVRKGPETLRMRSAAPGFTVNDIEKSLAWYRDVLGCIVKERWDQEGKMAGVEMMEGSYIFMLSQIVWKKGRDRAKCAIDLLQCTIATAVLSIATYT